MARARKRLVPLRAMHRRRQELLGRVHVGDLGLQLLVQGPQAVGDARLVANVVRHAALAARQANTGQDRGKSQGSVVGVSPTLL